MTLASQKPRNRSSRGPKPREEWFAVARDVLVHKDDPIYLNRTPIARSAYIERLVAERYAGYACGRGIAVRYVIKACLGELYKEMEGIEPMATIIELTIVGKRQRQIAKAIGVSSEHLCRTYRKMLIELLAEKLRGRVRDGSGKA